MFKEDLEVILNKKRQTVINFSPFFHITPIFNEYEDPLFLLEQCGLKTNLISEFFSFYMKKLFDLGIISDPDVKFECLESLNVEYSKYIPKIIDFESYIEVSKNRYLIIYSMKTCPLMRHCAVNFKIVFEYTDFNKDPAILVFPRWQEPERTYHQLCEQIFENLYDVFNHVNKTDESNILDTWTAINMEKEYFEQITILHQIDTI